MECSNPCGESQDNCQHNRVRVKAIGDNGFAFSSWSGVLDGSTPEIELETIGDDFVAASFVQRDGVGELDLQRDFSAFLHALGYAPEVVSSFDMNRIEFDHEERVFVGNGIPDCAELAVLEYVLQNAALDLSSVGGIVSGPVYDAWRFNLNVPALQLPDGYEDVERAIAALMTLGDWETVEMTRYLINTHISRNPTGIFSRLNLNPDDFDTSRIKFFYRDRDADMDGNSNLDEWISAKGDRKLYVRLCLGQASPSVP